MVQLSCSGRVRVVGVGREFLHGKFEVPEARRVLALIARAIMRRAEDHGPSHTLVGIAKNRGTFRLLS